MQSYVMTTEPTQRSSQDRERRAAGEERREPIRQDGPGEQGTAGSALEYRCRQVTASLREALGADGCSALLVRAIAECEAAHPVLKHMRGPDGREIQLEGVSAGIERYGFDAAETGVDAMFESLTGILGRLIGEDMAMRLMDFDAGESSRDQETL